MIGMALLRPDGSWHYANPAFVAMTGYGPEAWAGWIADDMLVHPEERKEAERQFFAMQRGETDQLSAERRYIRKDGSTLRALVSLSSLKESAEGAPAGYLLQIAELGQQRQVDNAVEEAEKRWNHALRGSRQIVWDFYVPSSMVWVSPGWKELLDLPNEERVHHIADWLDKMHPDDRPRLAEATERVRTTGNPEFNAVYRLRHHTTGNWVWVLSRGRVVEYAADGSIARMIGTIIDITREKEFEARLAEVTQRLEIALEAGGIGIYEVDLVAMRHHWDDRVHEIFGVSREDFDGTGDAWLALVHPEDVPRVVQIRESAMRSMSPYRADYRIRRPGSDKVRHVRSIARMIRGEDGTAIRAIGACWDITEDVERTQTLNRTLALLEAVMKGTPDLIYAKAGDGRYLLVNKSVERLMGRPRDEIIGRHDLDIFPPETAIPLIENDRRVMGDGKPYTIEELAALEGMPRTYSSTKAPLRDESGKVVGLLGISRDVTDLKATEAALRQSELRWQFALDGSGDGIWDWDLRSGRVFYSRQWKAMLGYEEEEIGTTTNEWSDRVHPGDLPHCWKIINEHLYGDTPDFTLEHRMRAKDGSWRWIFDRGRVIERDGEGRPLRVIGTHTDVTLRKQGETAILALNERLQLAVEVAGAGIFDLDFATERYTWDEQMYRIYGLSKGQYDGTLAGWLTHLHPDDVAKVMAEHTAAIDKTSIFSMDFRIRQPGSGAIRHVRSLARIVRDEAGAPIRAVGMNWDITDHMELAETLYEEKERLQITLSSIGDAVISTDAQARITFMNPVAEQMTGWLAADAVGRALGEVFPLVDEAGAAVSNSVRICLDRMRPSHLEKEAILIGRDGRRRHVRDSAAPVRTSAGEIIGAVLVFQDVTEARSLQQALEHSANHDGLTGLANRTAFERGLSKAVEQANDERREHTLCFIDLDMFKQVNDSAGHAAGDALLRVVADLLRRCCRSHDLAARLGGDEFALLLFDCPVKKGRKIAQRFIREVSKYRFAWEGATHAIGASIGLTSVGPEATQADRALSQADMACYASKTAGRNRVSVYGVDT